MDFADALLFAKKLNVHRNLFIFVQKLFLVDTMLEKRYNFGQKNWISSMRYWEKSLNFMKNLFLVDTMLKKKFNFAKKNRISSMKYWEKSLIFLKKLFWVPPFLTHDTQCFL